MKCEYKLCIYEEGGQCTVSEVSINTLGICESAIIATIPPEDLLRYKTETLVSMECSWKDNGMAQAHSLGHAHTLKKENDNDV